MNGPSATSGCAPTADLLPELALGILAGAERAEVLDHLDRCARCRAESEDWARAADVLPTLLADAEPPAGFEACTLERLRVDRSRVPRRSRMYRVFAVAAIVAAAMVVTLAAVRIIDARSSSPSSVATSAEMSFARMVGHGGKRAGDAFMTTGNERYMFLSVDYGVKTGMYRIEAMNGANRLTSLGNVAISGGHGAWAGELKRGGSTGTPMMVRLVDVNGKILCTGRFGPMAT